MNTSFNAILISNKDSVVTVTENIKAGDMVTYVDNEVVNTIQAATDVPIFHKISIVEVPEGEAVYKYCEKIGIATENIPTGVHVHTHNIKSPGTDE